MPLGVSAVALVVETRLGNICCTCWAMKPSCGVVPSSGSIQLKVTGLSWSMSEREEETSRDWMLVFRRSSEFWVSVPDSCALPPSKTAKTVVEALLTTAKAEVETGGVGASDLEAAVGGSGADADVARRERRASASDVGTEKYVADIELPVGSGGRERDIIANEDVLGAGREVGDARRGCCRGKYQVIRARGDVVAGLKTKEGVVVAAGFNAVPCFLSDVRAALIVIGLGTVPCTISDGDGIGGGGVLVSSDVTNINIV